jgi:uncharacterized protein
VLFSVRALELKKAHFDVSLKPGEIDFLDKKIRQVDSLLANGSVELLEHTADDIRVTGHVAVQMETECDRCLEKAVFPVDSDFDLYYRPAGEGLDEEVEIDDQELEAGFYENGKIELNDVLREHVLLALPMQKICQEDCKGICPGCGQNRNLLECDCHLHTGDDRWRALQNMKTLNGLKSVGETS